MPIKTVAPKLPQKPVRRYGWRPDKPDFRDLHVPRVGFLRTLTLPQRVDLRSKMPPVYDQGELGSCTANAIAAAIEYERAVQKLEVYLPSRLFIYYGERAYEGTIKVDAGAEIRDGIRLVATVGAPPESSWPYDTAQFAITPPVTAYADAKSDVVKTYARVAQVESQIKAVLAAGHPVVAGISVYSSFESNEVTATGQVDFPDTGDSMLGGHAILIVGYDAVAQVFICRNSWGADWGMHGYFTIPMAYITSPYLCSDLWSINAIA